MRANKINRTEFFSISLALMDILVQQDNTTGPGLTTVVTDTTVSCGPALGGWGVLYRATPQGLRPSKCQGSILAKDPDVRGGGALPVWTQGSRQS